MSAASQKYYWSQIKAGCMASTEQKASGYRLLMLCNIQPTALQRGKKNIEKSCMADPSNFIGVSH
jgi:hypothetical protein